MTDANVSLHLRRHAQNNPEKPALIAPTGEQTGPWETITYGELDAKVDAYAYGFAEEGIERADRVLFLLKPGIEFYSVIFALFRLGAIPVLLDPVMGIKPFLNCIEQIQPQALIAIPLAHVIRLVVRRPFQTANIFITAGTRWFWGGSTLEQCLHHSDKPFTTEPFSAKDEAFIAFTSGSTGPAKGVSYTNEMINTQVQLIGETYGLGPQSTAVECYAAFILFDLMMGMTVVIPDVNLSKPAQAAPAKVIDAINTHQADVAFGSPIIWTHLVQYAIEQQIELPSLEQVLTGGAPIQAELHRQFQQVLSPGVNVFTPYGATEALPIANIGTQEILGETWAKTASGAGTCVGTPFPGVDIRIIGISDDPLPRWSEELRLPQGEIGEIVIDGLIASPEYKDLPEENDRAKIHESGRIMHRMGDLGYLDDAGRLWFCGRKTHRLQTADGMIPAVPVEGIYNEHPSVSRTALVGVGDWGEQRPVLVVELHEGDSWTNQLQEELSRMTQDTRWQDVVSEFVVHPCLPTDTRHNSKIIRDQLARWATRRLYS
ncbi:MAG: AMP-binding protein [Proteobacteria bacterium]|jgi:olefin beta-lactone synthetase|nr:AMP-binding protein [Pseudomonadota bacterium]